MAAKKAAVVITNIAGQPTKIFRRGSGQRCSSILGNSWYVHEGQGVGYLFFKNLFGFQFLLNPTSCSLAVKGAGCTQCNTRLLYLWQSQRLRNFLIFLRFLFLTEETSPKMTESVPLMTTVSFVVRSYICYVGFSRFQ